MLQCPKCKQPLPSGWRVCPNCYQLPEPSPTKQIIVLIKKSTPISWQECFQLGCDAWLAGEQARALAMWQASLTVNPSNYLAHFNLGTWYLRQNLIDQARRHLVRVRHLKPDYLPGRVNLGTVYLLQGDPARAAAEYRYVLTQDPHHSGAQRGIQLVERLAKR